MGKCDAVLHHARVCLLAHEHRIEKFFGMADLAIRSQQLDDLAQGVRLFPCP
jgi:hypothetical protein